MKYGVNIGSAGNLIGIIKEYRGSGHLQGSYEFHCREGRRIVSAYNVDLKSFVPVVESEYAKALTEMRAIIKETNTSTITKEIYIPGTRAFIPKSKYVIATTEGISITGYSERTRKELCIFLMDARGKRDIIVMTKIGQPCCIIPPLMTEGSFIEIFEVATKMTITEK